MLNLINGKEFLIAFVKAWLVLTMIYYISITISYIFMYFLSLMVIIKNKHFPEKTKIDLKKMYPISIIVPAYNEEVSIIDSVSNLLKLEYYNYDIIIVNDGSSDKTLQKTISFFKMEKVEHAYDYTNILLRNIKIKGTYKSILYPKITLIDKENGGKSSALNTGIYFSKNQLVCCIDADTIIKKDALQKTVIPFMKNKYTIAVGGVLRVGNGKIDKNGNYVNKTIKFNLLPLLQTIEYERDFKLGRLGWAALKGTILISGAFGLFNKKAVEAVGGYNFASVGEDLELLLRMHNVFLKKDTKYEVAFIPEETGYTETPESYKILYNQRNRWHRGLMDSVNINQDVIFNPKHGSIGILTTPYYLLVELYGPLIKLINYFMIALAVYFKIVALRILIPIIIISFLFRVIMNLATLLLDNIYYNEHPNFINFIYLSIASVIDGIGYKQFVSASTFSGFIDYFKGKRGWGKMERKGIVDKR